MKFAIMPHMEYEIYPETLAHLLAREETEEQVEFFLRYIAEIGNEKISELAKSLSKNFDNGSKSVKFLEAFAAQIRTEMMVEYGGDYIE